MTALMIQNVDNVLVVDSRLIAIDLDIDHESLVSTIRKHQEAIEKDFGTIRFEIGSSNMSNGRVNPKPEKFAYLTEDQATFIATLSRNTPTVVSFKAHLVKSFSEAKNALLNPIVTLEVKGPNFDQINETVKSIICLKKVGSHKLAQTVTDLLQTDLDSYEVKGHYAKSHTISLLDRAIIVYSKKGRLTPSILRDYNSSAFGDLSVTDMDNLIRKVHDSEGGFIKVGHKDTIVLSTSNLEAVS